MENYKQEFQQSKSLLAEVLADLAAMEATHIRLGVIGLKALLLEDFLETKIVVFHMSLLHAIIMLKVNTDLVLARNPHQHAKKPANPLTQKLSKRIYGPDHHTLLAEINKQ